jgi:hypothetical protein
MPPAVPLLLLLGPYVAPASPPPSGAVDPARRLAVTVTVGGREVTIAPGRVAGLGLAFEVAIPF